MPRLRSSLFVVLAACAALGACKKPGPAGPPSKAALAAADANARSHAHTVTIAAVELRPIEGGLVASGQLLPREDTAVLADVTGYRVARVLADEGQWVSAGQPLAIMDDSLLHAQVQQQVALAAQQRVAAERADAEAARVKGIDGQGVLSQEQIDARRFAAKSARAAAAAQDAAASAIRAREGHMTVRAPYSGLVIERTVRQGDLSGASTSPWFRIAKDGQVELAADVPETALGMLKPGLAAEVTLADGTKVQGVIRIVSPRVDASTKLGRVRITLPVRPDVRSGGFARASFSGVARPIAAVPETAVRYDAEGASVLVVGADYRVTRVPVTTGVHGAGWVELLTGPAVGARVVDKAAAQLTPGDYIRPADTVAASPAAPAPAAAR
jgi:HlyD family secretion protein